jgi:hypothetical protein
MHKYLNLGMDSLEFSEAETTLRDVIIDYDHMNHEESRSESEENEESDHENYGDDLF